MRARQKSVPAEPLPRGACSTISQLEARIPFKDRRVRDVDLNDRILPHRAVLQGSTTLRNPSDTDSHHASRTAGPPNSARPHARDAPDAGRGARGHADDRQPAAAAEGRGRGRRVRRRGRHVEAVAPHDRAAPHQGAYRRECCRPRAAEPLEQPPPPLQPPCLPCDRPGPPPTASAD